VGTGISKTGLLDWGRLSTEQAAGDPDAVVVLIGANEGFELPRPGGGEVGIAADTVLEAIRQDFGGQAQGPPLHG
jgi:lysophospholipase L1-like esterase